MSLIQIRKPIARNTVTYLVVFCLLSSPLLPQQTVLLKDGRTLKGNIVSQDAESLALESPEGKRISIPKSNLLKVIYKQVDEAEEERIRKAEEEKLAGKQKAEDDELARRREEKKRELEEQRKKFDEEQRTSMEERQKSLDEKRKSVETSARLPSPDRNFKTHYELYQAFSKADLKIAPANAKCSEFAKSSDWYVLFGSIPITRPDVEKLLPRDNKAVRVRAENSWVDIGVSVVLGIAGSVTRRTIVVESCDLGKEPKTYTKEELELELEKQKFRLESEFMKEKQELLLNSVTLHRELALI